MPGSHGIAWSLKVYLTETQVCNLQFTLHYYNSVHSVCVCKSLFPLVYGCIVCGVRWCGWPGWCRLPGPLIFIGFHQRHLASTSHQPAQAGRCLISGYSHTLRPTHPQPAPGFYQALADTTHGLFLYLVPSFLPCCVNISACPDVGNSCHFCQVC